MTRNLSTALSACYGDEGARLAQLFQLAFDGPTSYDQNEFCSVKSILITGDSGVGKSTVLDRLANTYQVKISRAIIGEMAAGYNGQLAVALERLAWEIQGMSRGMLVLEDVDQLFPANSKATHEDAGLLQSALHRIAASFSSPTTHTGRILLVATTRDPSSIQETVRYLFEDSIHLPIPTPNERLAILEDLAVDQITLDPDVSLDALNSQAHGFVAADLARWCQLAREAAHREGRTSVSRIDFQRVLHRIRVQGLLQMAEKPEPTRWTDIGGLHDAKRALEESAIWVYKHADAYKRLGIRPSKGVLLFGPPGTGKTLLAKAVATESSANFMAIHLPDLIKSHVGESEKAVASIFQTAIRCSPCVIFLDELEAIFGSRETSGDVGKKLISQFLIEMDHLDKIDQNVILLGATNHPEAIDPSILRPGRLDRLVYVGLPTQNERLSILQVLGRKTRISPTVHLESIAQCTEGYTGADLKAVIRKAALLALKRTLRDKAPLAEIEQGDVLEAVANVVPLSFSQTKGATS
ncbi:P-loop containing nucleoside triphosphate hydrolase protein [Dichotomocladium elegans]|nr:P-loop containing nucleoside triphosphate hydrolase protein [Dichotomocladium elegans]